jgi:cell division transport system permease protein
VKGSQLRFVGRRLWNSLWTRLWVHVLTAAAIAVALFVFGAFLLVRENLRSLLARWSDQIQINAYLDNGLGDTAVSLLRDRIQNFPEVKEVRYISQQQAWKDFRAALGANSSLLEGLPEDVLPASFEIFLKRDYRDGPIIEAVAHRLRQERGLSKVEYPQEWVDRLSLVVLALHWAQWIVGGILFIASFVIVRSTLGLAVLAQKDEIELLRRVGAPEALIQVPFLAEGIIQGVLGAALSVLGLWLLVFFLRDQFPASLGFFGISGRFQFIDGRGVALLLGIGCLLGASGSVFSLRKFRERRRA